MPGFVDISVLGDKRLQRKLNRLSTTGGRAVVRKAMRPAWKPVLEAAKAAAPVESGKMRDTLKLRKAAVKSRSNFGVAVQTGTREELGIPVDATGYYPFSQEYGWTDKSGRRRAGKPFMRPAFDQNKDKAAATMRREIRRNIIAEAKRA